MNITKPILFFDGVCGLCNKSVDFLIRIDKNNHLLYAPLQGITAKKILERKYIDSLSTMAFHQAGKTHYKSTAILKSINAVGGAWRVFYVFTIIPAFIRDALYNLISSMRYEVFRKKDSCRVPSSDELNKILP